jgi:hypothetical protein
MDAARSYEHGRDAYLDHLGRKSRPGKPCASTRGFSCRCRRDGEQPPHSRISRGENADAVAVLVIGRDAPSRHRRAADVLGTVKLGRSLAISCFKIASFIGRDPEAPCKTVRWRLRPGFLLGRGRAVILGCQPSQVQGLSAPRANVPLKSLANLPCPVLTVGS